MIEKNETIVALATPMGRGGIAIIRISGPLVPHLASKILGNLPVPRYAEFRNFRDGNGQAIDEGIALYFPGPHSFTGEDILELHGHGGAAVINLLLQRIVSLGARHARPGEFSERAFLNGKIDLVQAEAIADLIDSVSEQASRASLRSLQGEFSRKINEVVESLIQLRSYVEAAIDFTDEEIDFLSNEQITFDLNHILNQLTAIQAEASQGSLLREGITIVISGPPNVGKSSLLNQLSGKDIAIVTDIAGTTRDLLKNIIHIDGLPVEFVDTAGMRQSNDPIEQEGIRRANEEIKKADLILCMSDASHETQFQDMMQNTPVMLIRNKIDLTLEKPTVVEKEGKKIISISAKTGAGIDLLKEQIKNHVGFQSSGEGTFSARRRHLDALSQARESLVSGYQQLTARASELLAEDLRKAQQALSEITGQFTCDDLLGRIFSSFCIGK